MMQWDSGHPKWPQGGTKIPKVPSCLKICQNECASIKGRGIANLACGDCDKGLGFWKTVLLVRDLIVVLNGWVFGIDKPNREG